MANLKFDSDPHTLNFEALLSFLGSDGNRTCSKKLSKKFRGLDNFKVFEKAF